MTPVTHQGVHGTTSQAADSIIAHGFRPSSEGRAGRGAYFWHINRFAESLAVEWAQAEKGEGAEISLLYADLICDEREVLDLENQVLHDRLSEIAFKRGITKKSKDNDISSLHDYYVTSLEKKLTTTFRLIKKKLAPPRKEYSNYPIIALGAPLAYIVRDVSIIKIGRRVDK